jgi:hypothetical protein
MARYSTFSDRTSGRDLRAVRRPILLPDDPTTLKKAELVALAEASGVDASGTKAEIVERLSDDG